VTKKLTAHTLAVLVCLGIATASQENGRSPEARGGHAMTFDARRSLTLMFGGGNRERAFDDLWGWNGAEWRLLSAAGPSARDSATLTYDWTREVTVLVGGRADGRLLADTWEWDGSRWSQRREAGTGLRLHHYAAYDRARRELVLYGGIRPREDRTVERLTDTWTWDGQAWTERDTQGIPGFPSGMTYDDERRQVVAIAVDATSPPDGERPSALWGWNGRRWTRLTPFGAPTLSPSQPLASTGRSLLILDGAMHKGDTAITWLWRGGRWARGGMSPPTPQRVSHAMAYAADRDRLVMFGGHAGFMPGRNGEMFGDTWEWTGSAWIRVGPR
jgi:hypothetical protein